MHEKREEMSIDYGANIRERPYFGQPSGGLRSIVPPVPPLPPPAAFHTPLDGAASQPPARERTPNARLEASKSELRECGPAK